MKNFLESQKLKKKKWPSENTTPDTLLSDFK